MQKSKNKQTKNPKQQQNQNKHKTTWQNRKWNEKEGQVLCGTR